MELVADVRYQRAAAVMAFDSDVDDFGSVDDAKIIIAIIQLRTWKVNMPCLFRR